MSTRHMLHPACCSLLLALAVLLPAFAVAAPAGGSARTHSGENPLGVARAEFAATQDGMELIYQRRYPEALQLFEEAGMDFPDSPLGPIGRGLVWQAIMFENYDFSHERAYLAEYAEAKDRIARAERGSSEPKAWIYFLTAVHLGVDAMWDIRHERYLPAFDKAWEALEGIKKVERMEPDFVDVKLATGMYDYWRTAITEEVDVLPSFGDHRAEGLAAMKLAKEQGLLASAPASLVLTYSYMEAHKYAEAIAEAKWAQERYPGNLLNEMTLGRVYRQAGKNEEALASFDRVLQIDPENKRVWFHIGEVHYKARRDPEAARAAYERYLKTDPLPYYRAHTLYRMGMLQRRARHYDEAIALMEQALAADPKLKMASDRLDELRQVKERRGSQRGSGKTVVKPR